ncbi:TetR family transcriptional regulator [Panacagrimonas perspica]|uniref:TetR family transcriptional regulator n=1 Tax=Panacagrimonas perspica TaxID=381431 RepID=A0A4R7P3S0_9GAMM|nr:TetR/AcrR family transcriptional regulator [Panacagrimonas perspica]TDU28072.1 TetR family transcriptional regulator [Panacagrimonas perspica]
MILESPLSQHHHHQHEHIPASQLEPLVPATARGEATRRKLLTAAEEEFGSKGFHAASVSSITTRASVGQGTFYLYFRSKDEVFVTLVREIGRNLRRAIREAAANAPNRMAAERMGIDAFFEFSCTHRGLLRIVQESQFIDESVFRDYYERLAKSYADDLELAARKGELVSGNAEIRAWALIGAGHFIGMRWCLWTGKVPPPAEVDAMMDMVARGIAPR